jgi:hypothetical protein
MKIPTDYRNLGAVVVAVLGGIAALIALAIVMRFSPFIDTHEAQKPTVVQLKVDSSPSEFFRGATAATPETVSVQQTPVITGGDSRFDNYRMERESCCVGN